MVFFFFFDILFTNLESSRNMESPRPDSQETVAHRRWRENESIPVTPRTAWSCHEEAPPPMIPANEDKLFMDLSTTSSIRLGDWSCDTSTDCWCLVHPQQGNGSATSSRVVAPRSTRVLSSLAPFAQQPRNTESHRSDPDTNRFLSSSSFSAFIRSPTAKANGNEKPSVHNTSSPTTVQCLSFAPLQRHDSWGRKEDHQISSWSDEEEDDDAGVLRFCGEGEDTRRWSPIGHPDLDLQSPPTDTPSRRVHPIPRIPNLQPKGRTLNLYRMNM